MPSKDASLNNLINNNKLIVIKMREGGQLEILFSYKL
jgi:hypothetical protein